MERHDTMFKNKKLLSVISTLMIFNFFATPALALTDAILDSTTNVESINGLNSNYTTINTVKQDNVGVQTNWTKFNVKAGETLDTNFQGQNQAFTIRVTGADMSTINGIVKSSGVGAATSSTAMINPNGWYVGPGGMINVNSLLMTTHDFTGMNPNRDLEDLTRAGGEIIIDGQVYTAQDSMFVANRFVTNNANIGSGGKVQIVTTDGMHYDLQKAGKTSLLTSTKKGTTATPAVVINGSNITGQNVEIAARVDGVAADKQSIVIAGGSAIRATNGDVFITAKADTGYSHITVNGSTLAASNEVGIRNESGNINIKNATLGTNAEATKLEASGNINLNTICVKGGDFDALTVDGDVNDTASNFKDTDATFTTKNGKVYLSSTNLDNSELELRNTNGSISVNNVGLKNNSFLNTLTNSNVEVNNLTVDASRAKIRSHAGDVDVKGLTNTNNSYTEIKSVEGDINVNDSTNTNNSTLTIARDSKTNPLTAGSVNITNLVNSAKSYLNIGNTKGDVKVDGLNLADGELAMNVEGNVDMLNSTIDAKIADSKVANLNISDTALSAKAQIGEIDGNMYLDNVTADANLKTTTLKNKNGEIQITNSAFNDLEATSTGDVTISTTTADKMTLDANNILVHNLTNATLINNAKAKGYAQFEGDNTDAAKGGVKFNNITAGDRVLVHGGTIETENGSGTVNAGTSVTLWTENQDVNLESLNGQTLDVDFEGNEVLARANTFFDVQTSDRHTLTIDQKLDDTGLDRDFILGAGQIIYPRTGTALKTTGTATLIDKKDDIDVRVSSDDANTISLDNFDVGTLNVTTDGANSGDIYVYMPTNKTNVNYDAKEADEYVYYIYPPVNGDDEVNKIQALGGDLASQAPTPISLGNLIPLGAAAKFDAKAKKHFVSIEDGGEIQEYRVLKGLPFASNKKKETREIY